MSGQDWQKGDSHPRALHPPATNTSRHRSGGAAEMSMQKGVLSWTVLQSSLCECMLEASEKQVSLKDGEGFVEFSQVKNNVPEAGTRCHWLSSVLISTEALRVPVLQLGPGVPAKGTAQMPLERHTFQPWVSRQEKETASPNNFTYHD